MVPWTSQKSRRLEGAELPGARPGGTNLVVIGSARQTLSAR